MTMSAREARTKAKHEDLGNNSYCVTCHDALFTGFRTIAVLLTKDEKDIVLSMQRQLRVVPGASLPPGCENVSSFSFIPVTPALVSATKSIIFPLPDMVVCAGRSCLTKTFANTLQTLCRFCVTERIVAL